MSTEPETLETWQIAAREREKAAALRELNGGPPVPGGFDGARTVSRTVERFMADGLVRRIGPYVLPTGAGLHRLATYDAIEALRRFLFALSR